jgi:hypothetical protein
MFISYRLFSLMLGAALTGCGGGLTFSDDSSPAALLAVSGDRQQGTVGRKLDKPLVVKLTDASSRPIPGVSVTFQFTSDVPEAEVDPVAETDSDGLASAEVRLGTSTGSHQVEARVATGAVLKATFVVTAVARGGRGGGDGDDDDDD